MLSAKQGCCRNRALEKAGKPKKLTEIRSSVEPRVLAPPQQGEVEGAADHRSSRFFAGAYVRMARVMVALAIVVGVVLGATLGWRFALGFIAGALVGAANFYWLKSGV